jgi:hypothetical protein
MAKKPVPTPAAQFWNVFGKGTRYREYSADDASRLAGRLPEVMLNILTSEGWCTYDGEVLWLCDPDDWETAARCWQPEDKPVEVFLRSGFGDLVLWDGSDAWFINVHESYGMLIGDDPDWIFAKTLTDAEFAFRTYLPELVARAHEQADPLAWDEIYTFVPALALGGNEKSAKIVKAKALEALDILRQLQNLKLY